MESTVKERLLAFIEYKGLSKNKFETMCGLSKRYVSNISQSISPSASKRISLTFPDLNMGWVLSGDGEMLTATHRPQDDPIMFTPDAMRIYLNMTDTLKSQQGTIAVLTDMASRRQDELSALISEMSTLIKNMQPLLKKEAAG